jgi:hypothetical protein
VNGAARTSHGTHGHERLAAAMALLESPPPLEGIGASHVVVRHTAVVHASRSRPVVRWELGVHRAAGPELPLSVIGKAYRAGGGEEAWRLLGRLRELGFDDPAFQVPAPFGWDPVRLLLAQEAAPPRTLHALVENGAFDEVCDLRRVGRWLARLHATEDLGLPTLAQDFEQRKLREYGTALARVLPSWEARITALVQDTIVRIAESAEPVVATHGDFQAKNVHLDRDRVVVIDFDRAAMAPAARDLGHFIGQTQTMSGVRHGAGAVTTGWIEAFLDGYVAGGGSPAAVTATPSYVARTYAEVLFYRLVVRPMDSIGFVPGWLDAWERCLHPGKPPS